MYHKKERRAVSVIVFLIISVGVLNIILPKIVKPGLVVDPTMISSMQALNIDSVEKTDVEKVKAPVPEFNVNAVSVELLMSYGLENRVAQTWVKYREAIGGFSGIEQINKVYGIDSVWVSMNADKMIFPSKKDVAQVDMNSDQRQKRMEAISNIESSDTISFISEERKFISEEKKITVDINRATEEEWQELKGIGPYYAEKIVNFREHLGGFVSIDQISDTYHLPDSVFSSIKVYLTESPVFRKIFINQVGIEDLAAHPYIDWKAARWIHNYRKQHGAFQNVSHLFQIKQLGPQTIEKIEPYLSFELAAEQDQVPH